MIIINSGLYDVQVKQNQNWQQRVVYSVIYGLQVKQFTNWHEAMMEFTTCVSHARSCNEDN